MSSAKTNAPASGAGGVKPKRPLTAYNIFFKEQREHILRQCGGNSGGFANLARTIAERWKNISPESHAIYCSQAAIDKSRYHREMVTWKTEQKAIKRQQEACAGADASSGSIQPHHHISNFADAASFAERSAQDLSQLLFYATVAAANATAQRNVLVEPTVLNAGRDNGSPTMSRHPQQQQHHQQQQSIRIVSPDQAKRKRPGKFIPTTATAHSEVSTSSGKQRPQLQPSQKSMEFTSDELCRLFDDDKALDISGPYIEPDEETKHLVARMMEQENPKRPRRG